jgi:hypothetical protein
MMHDVGATVGHFFKTTFASLLVVYLTAGAESRPATESGGKLL